MMSASAQGVERFAASVREAGGALGDLSGPNDQVAGWLGGRIVQAAPRVTGTLAGSITVTGSATGVTTTVGAPYGAAVHKQNPFIARTIDQAADDAVADIAQGVEDTLATIKGS